ncbi:carboxypeptidase regulatory-like domain-containing protein [uncultured Paludibaculum sp.]|uniref:carboxypeptidase regulatory-like domain-containing protein n=1 Tax=uncultured Paludibaculum sp. TaxID=1765020 RepID=UPI002AAC36EF|nr:carboxypeptidase regulatory-like domain-containing protein [uncultured Paludibaculum sp.]
MRCRRTTQCACVWLTVSMLCASDHHGAVRFGAVPVPGATVIASQGSTKLAAITDAQGAYGFPDLADGTWTVQVSMLCFVPMQRTVEVRPKAPGEVWALQLLPMEKLRAMVVKAPALGGEVVAASAAGQAVPSAQTRPATGGAHPKRAPLPPTVPVEDSGAFEEGSELDAFVINGSASFGLERRAIGNVRRGRGRLYSGGLTFGLENSTLNARPFSLTGQDTPQSSYNRMRFGVYLGGPLMIPRTQRGTGQFYVAYQATRNRNASTLSGLVPTPAMREGDLSGVLDARGVPVGIYDPATGAPFPRGRVPVSREAQALLALYPRPNFGGSSAYNYQVPIVGTTRQEDLQTRVSARLGAKSVLAAAFSWHRDETESANLFDFHTVNGTRGVNAQVSLRHAFTPRLSLDFGGSLSQPAVRITPYLAYRTNVSAEAGIAGNDQAPENWGPPSLSFSSGVAELSDQLPSYRRDQTAGVSVAGTWIREPHTFKFGAELRRQQFNSLGQEDARGRFTFNGAATRQVLNGVPVAGTGSDFADFLLGIPDTASIAYGNADKYFRAPSGSAWFTDDWRINSAITINMGLRWEYSAPITEKYGRLVNLNMAPGFAAAEPVLGRDPIGVLTGTRYPNSLIRPDRRAMQPRVAMAWRPSEASSMVVRAGYGIYFDSPAYERIASRMAQQAPLSKSLSVENSAATPLTLANGLNASPQGALSTFAVDPDYRLGYAQTWQLSVQQGLPGAMVATVSYLGTKGARGMQQFLPNTYPTGAANPCSTCPAGFLYITSNGNSRRHAAQAQVRRRLHSGLAAMVEYTFAKAIDNAQVGGFGQGNATIAQDWLNLARERGLSSFDQRHLLRAQAQYTTGMGVAGGARLRGWQAAALQGWTLQSEVTVGSGLPENPVYPVNVRGTGVTGSVRPDATGLTPYGGESGRFLNAAAFRAPATGAWGNAGRNSLTGPGQFSVNASLGRAWSWFDLRFDVTNALNHVTFPSWNAVVTSASFGLPMTANPMRSVQTTLRIRF